METILAHPEHTANRFRRTLSIRRNCNYFQHTFQRMLSMRETDFIAHCGNVEPILAHTEHTGKRFWRTLSQRRNVKKSNISAILNSFFKNLELQALGTIRIRFLQKNEKKISHACVPLRGSKTANLSMKYLQKATLGSQNN